MYRTNHKVKVQAPDNAEAATETPAATKKTPEAKPETVAPDASVEQLQRLQAERDALFDRLARQQAEFDNFRKRSQKEQAEFREYAIADAVKAFLQVMDNLDLALKAPTAGQEGELRKGVELIRNQMEDALTRLGVTAIPAEGAVFDPRVHEAVEMVDTDKAEDHRILSELQRGYRLKDRMLRPAMVRVARNPKSH